jgi:hypothetical protein
MARPRSLLAATAALALAVPAASLHAAALHAASPDAAQSPLPPPPPLTVPDAYDAPHAGTLRVDAAAGLLSNDQGIALVAELWTEPIHGAVTLEPDGAFLYARTDPAGSDTFTYLAVDAVGQPSSPTTVTIRFANQPPDCSTTHLETNAGAAVEFDLATACTDGDGDDLAFTYQRPDVPPGSIWEADAQGHIRFEPPTDWVGTGTVLFSASDGITTTTRTLLAIRVVASAPPDASAVP